MNNYLKQVKVECLNKVKVLKQNLENSKNSLIAQKFSAKKQIVDEENVKLDTAFVNFKQAKELALKEEIEAKFKEVQEKKAKLLESAKISAENEAVAEINLSLVEFDKEIETLEKEINS